VTAADDTTLKQNGLSYQQQNTYPPLRSIRPQRRDFYPRSAMTAHPSVSRSIVRLAKFAMTGTAIAAAVCIMRERRRMNFNGKTVLISGASRGLGLEIARAFADEGANLVLLARDAFRLAETARELQRLGTNVLTFACDISQRTQMHEVIATIIAKVGRIDVLVNNAGTIQVGPLENMELSDYESAMAVHYWGPLYLMEEITPHMKAAGQGRIVNIASISGKVAVPHLLPYAASKFALVGLSEGMRAELIKDGIYVTTACPGLMRTGSHLQAFFKGQHKKEYALFALANASPLLSTSSMRAAREIVEACRFGKAEITITPQARLLCIANGLFPALVSEAFGLLNRILPCADEPAGRNLKPGREIQSLPGLLTRSVDRAAARNNELPTGTDH
jgi:short-subunit dehydrogenase